MWPLTYRLLLLLHGMRPLLVGHPWRKDEWALGFWPRPEASQAVAGHGPAVARWLGQGRTRASAAQGVHGRRRHKAYAGVGGGTRRSALPGVRGHLSQHLALRRLLEREAAAALPFNRRRRRHTQQQRAQASAQQNGVRVRCERRGWGLNAWARVEDRYEWRIVALISGNE